MTISIYVRFIDGESNMDANGMGLLFGVTPEEVTGLPMEDGVMPIPNEWIKRGRQRANEASAHTGGYTLVGTLAYWAEKDHHDSIEVIYQ